MRRAVPRGMGGWLAACALLAAALSARASLAARETGARALFDRALRGTRDARASFTQTQHGPLGAVTTRGTFEYARPRRVRMAWTGPAAATAWVVEDTVWFDQPGQGRGRARQRARHGRRGRPVRRSLARGPGARLPRQPRTAHAGSTWRPRDPGRGVEHHAPRARPGERVARTADLVTTDGGTTRIAFGAFQVNRGIAPSRFVPRFARGRIVTGWMP